MSKADQKHHNYNLLALYSLFKIYPSLKPTFFPSLYCIFFNTFELISSIALYPHDKIFSKAYQIAISNEFP